MIPSTHEDRGGPGRDDEQASCRALVEQAPVALVRYDFALRVTLANAAAGRLLGVPAEALPGLALETVCDARALAALRAALAGEAIRCDGEWAAAPGNRRVAMNLRASPLRDGRGTVVGAMAVVEAADPTAVPEDAAALRELNRGLEARAAALTAELAAAMKELESFSHSVSHDLRAPLRAIDGFSVIIANELGDRLSDDGRSLLGQMRGAVQRMASLIDGLLGLARVSRHAVVRETVDLSALAAQIVASLARDEPGRAVAVEIEPGMRAEADPSLVRIALEHLLDNAWKFTARQPQPRIRFHRDLTRAGEEAFCIEDNGAGFNMRYAHKLFGAFQRLHHERDFPGTGIGLATVARIVQRHGGRAWAQGEVDRGASFCFTLAGAPASGPAA